MRHDDLCEFNEADCGCARRAAARRRDQYDAAVAYRFIMLGARVPPESYPRPFVAWPLRIQRGERFGMTEDGAFVLRLL